MKWLMMLVSALFPAARVPKSHPLRPIREMADATLKRIYPVLKDLYAPVDRHSIPPEKLLRSLLLQIFYSIRCERMLAEQLEYNLLFRWFVGLSMSESIRDHSVYTKNREHLLRTDIAVLFLRSISDQAEAAGLLSSDHFTVDGALVESWSTRKCVHPRDQEPPSPGDRNPAGRNFHVGDYS